MSGYTLRGEFLSVKAGRVWTDRDGNVRRPWVVMLLVGDRAVAVEFRNEEEALGFVGEAERGEDVAVPVRVYAKARDWLAVTYEEAV